MFLKISKFYRNLDSKVLVIFLLSISSGLPFLLILSTLSIWLIQSGSSKTDIGIFAWVTLPYAFKFLWVILLESYKLPYLNKWLGHRRSWLLLLQSLLIFSLLGISNCEPQESLTTISCWAFLIGFFSANQDIVIETYRLEILPRKEVALGASASVLGYRIGMLISGSGALYLAHYLSWELVYKCMAICMFIGIFATFLGTEPTIPRTIITNKKNFTNLYIELVKKPLGNFCHVNNLSLIIIIIIFFKFADTVLNIMTIPFLIELGFTKLEIANVAKSFGIAAMIVGGITGSIVLMKVGLRLGLIICTCCQLLASLLYVGQAIAGHNMNWLLIIMGVENFTCGMSQIALVAYLSNFCFAPYVGSHYALLSSIASLIRISISPIAGYLADHMVWTSFYYVVSLSCIPSLLLLSLCTRHFTIRNYCKSNYSDLPNKA